MQNDTLTSYMKKKYEKQVDKNNLLYVGLTDTEFRKFIIDYLLGKDWYVVDPLSMAQINEVALYAILEKYSERYRKEKREEIKEWNRRVKEHE